MDKPVLGGRIPKRLDNFDEATLQTLHEAKLHHDAYKQLARDAADEHAIAKRLIFACTAAGMTCGIIGNYLDLNPSYIERISRNHR